MWLNVSKYQFYEWGDFEECLLEVSEEVNPNWTPSAKHLKPLSTKKYLILWNKTMIDSIFQNEKKPVQKHKYIKDSFKITFFFIYTSFN